MKWIGQHIWDFISRFRNDVYLEDLSNPGADTDKFLVIDVNNKVGYRAGSDVLNDIGAGSGGGDITGVTAGDGLTGGGDTEAVTLHVGAGTGINVAADAVSVDVSDFMTNGSDNRVVTATGTDAMNAEANLTFDGSTLSIEADSNTTADALSIDCNSLTSGNALFLDVDSSLTNTQSVNCMHLDFDKTGDVAGGQTVSIYGLDIDMHDTATNNVGATFLTGAHITIDHVNNNGTAAHQRGVMVNLTDADPVNSIGYYSYVENGGIDFKAISTANNEDYFTLATAANGATTLTTVDGDAAAANFSIVADGQFSVSSTGIDIAGDGTITNAVIGGGQIVANTVDSDHYVNGSVDYEHIQNVTDERMLGRDAGSDGVVTEMTATNVRSFINVADGAEVNVQSDWDAVSGDSQILNKPSIPSISGLASETYVNSAVSNLVDSAPGALDTLNELAAALGDDASFSTTVTNSIATKLPLAGGAMTGAITTNSTFDGRNVSADGTKLDGIENNATADQTDAEIRTAVEAATDSNVFTDADHTKLDGITAGISDGNYLTANDVVANDDFLRIDGTEVEGLSAAEVKTALSLNNVENTALSTGNAATATALATARAFQTDLASTSSANFDGSAANTHGVTGTLPTGNGGTGSASTTYCSLTANVSGILPVANGGTGAASLDNLITLTTHTTGNYVASLTAGSLIDLQNNTGEGATPTIDVDLSELTDGAGAAIVGSADELVYLDDGAQKRKLISGINLGQFNNDQSWNNYTHPNHTGEVTSTADGATVIADDVVDEANLKISNAGSNGNFLSKQSGDTGGLTWAAIPTLNQDTTGNADTATLASTVTVTDSNANTDFPVVFHDESNALLDDTAAFEYNPSSGNLTVTTVTGNITGNVTGNTSGSSGSCTGNAATATAATTVTVTDNESTAENNLITFVADAGDATGAHGLEMDGNFHYNPNTGLLSSTGMSAAVFTGDLTGDVTGDVEGNADTVSTIAGLAPNTATTQANQPNITTMTGFLGGTANALITDDGDGTVTSESTLTYDSGTLTVTSSTDELPYLVLDCTHAGTGGPVFSFQNNATGEDNDGLGIIYFSGDNAADQVTNFASITGSIVTAADTDEAGKLDIRVAASNGTSSSTRQALTATGHGTNNTVDIGLGYGAASTTTVAGDLTVTSKAVIPTRKFTATSSTHFEHQGDVIYFGGGSTTQGDLCYLQEDGEWGQADADGAATGDDADRDATGMLAIALGNDPAVNGMLIRGVITMDYDMGDVANPIYISTTAGAMTSTAPTASGDFVRIVGYCLDDANGQIYFNPDNTWVEITA